MIHLTFSKKQPVKDQQLMQSIFDWVKDVNQDATGLFELLEDGASPNAYGTHLDKKFSALTLSIQRHTPKEWVEQLIEKGANPNGLLDQDIGTPLIEAIKHGYGDIFDKLLEKKLSYRPAHTYYAIANHLANKKNEGSPQKLLDLFLKLHANKFPLVFEDYVECRPLINTLLALGREDDKFIDVFCFVLDHLKIKQESDIVYRKLRQVMLRYPIENAFFQILSTRPPFSPLLPTDIETLIRHEKQDSSLILEELEKLPPLKKVQEMQLLLTVVSSDHRVDFMQLYTEKHTLCPNLIDNLMRLYTHPSNMSNEPMISAEMYDVLRSISDKNKLSDTTPQIGGRNNIFRRF